MKKCLIVISVILIVLIIVAFLLIKLKIVGIEKEEEIKPKNQTEMIPEEEISTQELRTTEIKLYFVDNENKIVSETRNVDVKTLLEDPYKEVLEKLIEGPVDNSYKSIIGKDVKILDTEVKNGIITINFSEGFGKAVDKKMGTQKLLLKTIYKTLSEFKEINGIKIKVEGKEIERLGDDGMEIKGVITSKSFE